ncbi:MAG: GTP cyclohydrolase [Gammaproteobacteria bacterium RIFCSPLOWO2_02_FULL_57_10]|nr:MAG: GTP cyclohydrolase [Gammaproteobacteria bacterium RIFCSPLOWO2_02_FULL_57_10]
MNLNQQIEQWLGDNRERFHDPERPFVTLSYAQSLDGSITLRAGESLGLSGEESTRLTHHLRSLHDGILVGIGTVLADDPQLNVRQWTGPSPQPIVLDSHLRIPADARLCHIADKHCWVLTSRHSNSREQSDLDIITLAGDAEGRVCLHEALRELKRRGINSLMVEGGANVITAFLKEQLVDALVLTIAPTVVGGYKAVGDLGFANRAALPRIAPMFTEKLGDDQILWGTVRYSEESS